MTDPRLDQALERAAELVAAAGTKGDRLGYGDALEGWADAVRALRVLGETANLVGDGWIETDVPLSVRIAAQRAIASFIRAMLGGDDG